MGLSKVWTSKRLRSEGNGGRLRLGKLSADIAEDAETAALIRVLGLLTHVGPPPVRSQRNLHLLEGLWIVL